MMYAEKQFVCFCFKTIDLLPYGNAADKHACALLINVAYELFCSSWKKMILQANEMLVSSNYLPSVP
jgi:hypothetical protein